MRHRRVVLLLLVVMTTAASCGSVPAQPRAEVPDSEASAESLSTTTTSPDCAHVTTTVEPAIAEPVLSAYATAASADDLIGRQFSFNRSIEAQLAMPVGLIVSTQSLLSSSVPFPADIELAVFNAFAPAGSGGAVDSMIVFSQFRPPDSECAVRTAGDLFVVTHAFDIVLGEGEHHSLGGGGCRVGGVFDRSVVAVLAPPTLIDDRGEIQSARRAWSYTIDALLELDVSLVTCELESG